MAKPKENPSESWSVSVTDEKVISLMEELTKKTLISRSQLINQILLMYIPELLENDDKLLQLLTVND